MDKELLKRLIKTSKEIEDAGAIDHDDGDFFNIEINHGDDIFYVEYVIHVIPKGFTIETISLENFKWARDIAIIGIATIQNYFKEEYTEFKLDIRFKDETTRFRVVVHGK